MPTRRHFLTTGLGGAALMALPPVRRAQAGPIAPAFGKVVAEAPFARIEALDEGVWAVVSTPLKDDLSFGDLTTLCNGGLIAGSDKVVAIDGFLRPQGAAWLSDWSEKLTGKRPDMVIVTHFHADHSGGLVGYQRGGEGPEVIMTDTTKRLIFERYGAPRPGAEEGALLRLRTRVTGPSLILPDKVEKHRIDLGGRMIRLHALAGHTPSDVAIHVEGSPVIFAGDLVWQGLFHNFTDAVADKLGPSVDHLLKDAKSVIVTGHGGVARAGDLATYRGFLAHVETHARKARAAGKSVDEAAADFAIPKTLGDWHRFNPAYDQIAMQAWYRVLA